VIVVVDYDLCNVGSVLNMLKRIGAEVVSSADPAVIADAEKLILPGVGAFDNAMINLERLQLIEPLHRKVKVDKTPLLGICLGMQLLSRRSEEGTLPGFGWLEADTKRFNLDAMDLRIPHMGWNELVIARPHPLLDGLDDTPRYYFVHSYHVCCDDPADAIGSAHYGSDFTAVVARGNVMGTQFHPEKSHRFGMQLMRNFVEKI
jgi:imidazole glycerol-phosphate synthase subunit HisH